MRSTVACSNGSGTASRSRPDLPASYPNAYAPLAFLPAATFAALPRLVRSTRLLGNQWGDRLAPWTIDRAVRALRSGVGLPDEFRFHDLRHYFASLLISEGLDVKTVQARMRHSSAKTTLDTYAHIWPDSDAASRPAVSRAFDRRAPQSAAE